MNLALLVLDGPLKNQIIYPQENLVFSGSQFRDAIMSEKHAYISLDQNLSWKINALDNNTVRAGTAESQSLSLMNGLIFHLGQTGFKIIERPQSNITDWKSDLIAFLEAEEWTPQLTEFFFYLYPVRITFLQGPQTDEFYTLSYGPREMGYNHLDLTIKDPTQPRQIAKFFQVGETAYIETLCDDKILVNGHKFSQHPIANGDKITFGSNVAELTILK